MNVSHPSGFTPLETSEVASLLGVSIATVHRRVHEGKLEPFHKATGLRGRLLFDPAEVARFRAGCPGPHQAVQHHVAAEPWCRLCGHSADGTRRIAKVARKADDQ